MGGSTAAGTAADQYAAALAALAQPAWPQGRGPADPYGRTLALFAGDLVWAPGDDGVRDLAVVTGAAELAQGIAVLVGTPLATDIFNVLFGLDLRSVLSQDQGLPRMRELVRLAVVGALAQEPRIRQLLAVAFCDEPAYLQIHPELTAAQQAALADAQRVSRLYRLGILADVGTGVPMRADVEGVGP